MSVVLPFRRPRSSVIPFERREINPPRGQSAYSVSEHNGRALLCLPRLASSLSREQAFELARELERVARGLDRGKR